MISKTKKLRFDFIRHFDRFFRNEFCWADCVSWAYNFRVKNWNPFNIEEAKSCREESEESKCGTCYCGRFYKGLAISDLTEIQADAARKDLLTEREIRNIKLKQLMRERYKERVYFLIALVFFLLLGMLAVEAAFVSSIKF